MGPILSRFTDLRDPALDIDILRPELPEFTITVNPDGTSTASPTMPVLNGYILSIYGVQAWASGGWAAAGLGPSLVSFNIQEAGRAQAVFKKFTKLEGFSGQQDVAFYFPYRCMGGTDLEGLWSVDPNWVALVNQRVTFGIRLVADYYRCPPASR